MKIKIICGYRRDQEHTIDASEAHKAYALFLNPQMRTIFSNGLAIVGEDIKEIVPDYNATMGWNASHNLDSDDWNEIRNKGIDEKMRLLLGDAKAVAYRISETNQLQLLNKPLAEVMGEMKLLN